MPAAGFDRIIPASDEAFLEGDRVPDAIFAHPRLAAIYDAVDGDRHDLDAYLDLAAHLGARSALDVGCGTGTFALLMAARGITVTAVDPARASLDVARAKPGAGRIHWLDGDASTLPPMQVDLATMTANVAQAIIDPADWLGTLQGVRAALRPGGHLAFETRDPAFRGWREWNRTATYRVLRVESVGDIEHWVELVDDRLPLVTFRTSCIFAADGAVFTSDSTICFRERSEVEASLIDEGYEIVDVRDAPDRPGRELIFIARRPA